jgi:hypothetical protein
MAYKGLFGEFIFLCQFLQQNIVVFSEVRLTFCAFHQFSIHHLDEMIH